MPSRYLTFIISIPRNSCFLWRALDSAGAGFRFHLQRPAGIAAIPILCRDSRWPNRHTHSAYDISPVSAFDGEVVDAGAEIHGVVDFGYKSAKYQVNGSWQIGFIKEDNCGIK